MLLNAPELNRADLESASRVLLPEPGRTQPGLVDQRAKGGVTPYQCAKFLRTHRQEAGAWRHGSAFPWRGIPPRLRAAAATERKVGDQDADSTRGEQFCQQTQMSQSQCLNQVDRYRSGPRHGDDRIDDLGQQAGRYGDLERTQKRKSAKGLNFPNAVADAFSFGMVPFPGGQSLQNTGDVDLSVNLDSVGIGGTLPFDAFRHRFPVQVNQMNLCETTGETGQVQVVAVAGAQQAEPGSGRLWCLVDKARHRFAMKTVKTPIIQGFPVEPHLPFD